MICICLINKVFYLNCNFMRTNFKTLLLILFAGLSNNDCRDDAISIEYTKQIPNKSVTSSIIFEDNFDKNGIPDKNKWRFYYRLKDDGWGNWFSESYDQAYVKDGVLVLKAEKVGNVYRTGGLTTQDLFKFTYGKLEIRAKFKTFEGGSPSLWILNTTGQPINGEIDLAEQYNNDDFVYHTVWNNYTLKLKQYDPVNKTTVKYNVNEFNVYAIDWTSEKIVFSVNGINTMTYPNMHLANEKVMGQWPFNKPFYILITFPVSLTGVNDSELPGYMMIDWVKVTQ